MMTMSLSKVTLFAATVLLISVAAFFIRTEVPGNAGRTSANPAPKPEPGVLRYEANAPQLSAIKTEIATLLPLPLAEPLNGRLTFNENLTARINTPVAGRVTALKVEPGDLVREGDVLVTIDAPDVGSALSDLAKAKSDQVRKRLAAERARTLFDNEVLARKDLESAQADYDQARAETARAQLHVRNLTSLSQSIQGETFALRSPIAGIVADRQVNPGAEIRPDNPNPPVPLFIITDLKSLWLLVDLPERHLGNVAVGRPVSVEVDAYPNERFTARIEKIAPAVDATTRRVQVRCTLSNPDGRLKPEMYARVTLLKDEATQAVRLPNPALFSEGVNTFVFVEETPGVFRKRRVTLAVQDHEYAYASTGLKAGERFVSSGAILLNSELAAGS